jgi:hypothetical protein
MNPKRSEVFENYAKIALDEGLITKKAYSMTEDEKNKDSDWKSTIQALYGVKPNGEEKEDILDKAHPTPVVVSPSYDKVHGLVENLKERQNIMIGIVQKPNNGNYCQKYAETKNELLLELIRVGFILDNKNIEDLRKLADSCSERLVKEAIFPAALLPAAMSNPIGWIGIGVAAVAGLAAIINNTSPSDQGVLANVDRAIEWVREAQESVPQIRNDLNKLIEDLVALRSISQNYLNIEPVDVSTPEKFVNAEHTEKDKFAAVKTYQRACRVMSGRIPQYVDLLNNVKEQSSSWGDWIDKIVDVYRYVDPGDAKEAALALETLHRSLLDAVKESEYFMNQAKQQEPSLIKVLEKSLGTQEDLTNHFAEE